MFGVVLGKCDSKVIGTVQRTCRFQGSVLQAEVMAIDFALERGREFGHSNVIIESNCVEAIQVAMSNNGCYLPLEQLWRNFEPRNSILFLYVSSIKSVA
ncbi:hypothetical protein SLEP1_g51906 [Rubroshorea leprosula]|uniref:RNase H type-1 domain-containing protein n=1 Tax=Rubroshorea leprosula TaxID=152421 RepID=A0AAV5M5P4_9ROSI|nr:hypothetical protein SLEP1_g51906 [Rubroshorea leprosula]